MTSVVGHVLCWGSLSSQLILSQLRDLIKSSELVLRSSRNSFKSKKHVSACMSALSGCKSSTVVKILQLFVYSLMNVHLKDQSIS